MIFRATKTLAATLALTASIGLALPAAATPYYGSHAARVARHHAMIRNHAWHMGYARGFRDGHLAAAGLAPGDVATGRSAYVEPGPAPMAGDPGLLGGGGLLGTGVLGGNGVLGTGVLNGQGALGLGVLGL